MNTEKKKTPPLTYRIIEHKTNKITGGLEIGEEIGRENREIKPVRLTPKPYSFEPGTLFVRKILIWFGGDWWLTDNPEQEFGRPSHYIELPELPAPKIEEE